MNVLVVDDDADLAKLIGYCARTLWPHGQVTIAADGAQALRDFAATQPDLVILDVMMPPPDGFEVCRQIRATSPVPILMLTARDAVLDEVRALDLGADDYLTKPFDHLKLLAHLRALVRRVARPAGDGRATESADLTVEDLTVDFTRREVRVEGAVVDLSPTEYLLLEMLARNAGQILPHRALLERVWGASYMNETHYLKVFVNRLRQKLGDDAAHPRYIQTRRGVGYRFVAPQP